MSEILTSRVEDILQDKPVKPRSRVEELLQDLKASISEIASVKFWLGITTTALADGSTVNPITIEGESVIAEEGGVASYNNKEFIFNGTAWQELGSSGGSLYPIAITKVGNDYSSNKSFSEINTAIANGMIPVLTYSSELYYLHSQANDRLIFQTVGIHTYDVDVNRIQITSSDLVVYGTIRNYSVPSGGTTGQYLKKTSDVALDGDFVWADMVPVKRVTVTLSSNGWSNKAQTVTATGVKADETAQLIQPVPASLSKSEYENCGVKATSQAANSLTFSCDEVPSSDLTVYVCIMEVGA